jgi:hypothetical protein
MSTTTHSTIKTSLSNIIKDMEIYNSIMDAVLDVNKIVIMTNLFINAYLTHCYKNNEQFPTINQNFILYAQQMVSKSNGSNHNEIELRSKMIRFYKDHFKDCIENTDIISRSHINVCLSYEVKNMLTMMENNITEHFIRYINKFVNVKLNTRGYYLDIKYNKKISDENKKILIKQINDEANAFEHDLITGDRTSLPDYHEFIDELRKEIIPRDRLKIMKETDKPLTYDIKVSPFSYLRSMFYLNDQIEKINKDNEIQFVDKFNNRRVKLFQIIPQRTRIIPCHITITSPALQELANGDEKYTRFKRISGQTEKTILNKIWDQAFNLDNKVFHKKKYEFSYFITTNGKDVSIVFHKEAKNTVKTTKKQKKEDKQTAEKGKYISEVKITERMKRKNIVAIDPNLGDLNHCAMYIRDDHTGDKRDYLREIRYTRGQRNQDGGVKKFTKQMNELKKGTIINEKSVIEHERILSEKYDSKTVNNVLEYCKAKMDLNRQLFEHYEEPFYRKVKWFRYINRQKSESKYINNFKKAFGNSKECIVIYGDWSEEQGKKGNEPGVSKRLRKVFKNNGYKLYLIDEYGTSRTCNKCLDRNEQSFMEHVKKSTGKKTKVWGLQRCKNVKCNTYHNRDSNACMNMLNITKCIFSNTKIPEQFICPVEFR